MDPSSCHGLVALLKCLTTQETNIKPIELASSVNSISIRGFVAQLTTDLVYVNNFGQTVEVSYTCPIDAKSAVYHFEAHLNGRIITGHCLERKKAETLYKNAVQQGHTAIIATEDQLSSDVLHLSLGNLDKGEEAKLHLCMVIELLVGVDGSVSFTLPSVFNPRYSPSSQDAGPSQSVLAFQSNVFQTQSKDYSITVNAEVIGGNKIDQILSHSDVINVIIENDETSAKIVPVGELKKDHDWGFKIHYRTPYFPQALKETGDHLSTGLMADDVLMINFFPEMPLEAYCPHNEIIFLVDRSGSMEGDRIDKAKSALHLFLKSLPQGCRFNIVSFGSTFSALFPSVSERYTATSLQQALDLQANMSANMGGTEIFPAMKFIYSQELIPGYARKILVLTDGAVWNVNEVLEMVARRSSESQVFSVGIGEGASTALVQGLARAGKGLCEMVVDSNQLQMKVMGLVASMLQNNVTDVSVKVEVDPLQKVNIIPDVPPNIFGGQHLLLYARVTPNSVIKSISIMGKVREKTISCEVSEENCKTVHDAQFSLHRLAAKSQLNFWQINNTEGIEDEMLALSLASGVICRKTAIVGIDQEGKVFHEKEEEDYCVADCAGPPGIAPGGGAMFRSAACPAPPSLFGSAKSFAQSTFGVMNSSPMTKLQQKKGRGGGPAPPKFYRAEECKESLNYCISELSTAVASDSVDEMMDVVSFQNFDGSWSLENCLQVLKLPDDQFQQLRHIQTVDNLDDVSFATTVCLSLLAVRFASRKQEWNLIAMKGNMFLQSKGVDASKVVEKFSAILKQILAVS